MEPVTDWARTSIWKIECNHNAQHVSIREQCFRWYSSIYLVFTYHFFTTCVYIYVRKIIIMKFSGVNRQANFHSWTSKCLGWFHLLHRISVKSSIMFKGVKTLQNSQAYILDARMNIQDLWFFTANTVMSHQVVLKKSAQLNYNVLPKLYILFHITGHISI